MKLVLDPISGKCIEVGLAVGLFETLGKTPQSLAALAAACGCSERGLKPLLDLLASAGLLRIKDGGYRLASGAMRYVKGRFSTDWAAFPVIPEYQELQKAVRTGAPTRLPVEGEDDGGAFFSQVVPVLFDLHLPDAEFLAEHLPQGLQTALDLGAGSAVWSLALARRRSGVKVVAVDRAQVLEKATAVYVERFAVGEQYELRAGDYHTVALEEGGYDLVFLGHLLHADGWQASRTLLARSWAALKPGGLIAVAEIVAGEPRSAHYASNVFDLNMLMLTEHGTVFTARELEQLVVEAGFAELSWLQGPGEYPTLLARKA